MNPNLLILAGFLYGLTVIILKKIVSKKYHSTSYTTVIYCSYALFSFPLLFIDFHISTTIGPWLLVLASTIIYSISTAFSFKAYKIMDASTMSIISRLNIVFAALLGILFLKELYVGKSYIGLAFIFISALLLTYEGKSLKMNAGSIYVIVQSLLSALAALLDKLILLSFSSYTYVFINNFLVGSLFLLKKETKKEFVPIVKKNFWLIILTSIFGVVGWTIFLFVLKSTDVSRTIPIYKSIVLFTPVVLGILLLKETKNLWQKMLGLTLGIIGIVFLTSPV